MDAKGGRIINRGRTTQTQGWSDEHLSSNFFFKKYRLNIDIVKYILIVEHP